MNERLTKLAGLMEQFGLAGVALNPGPSLVYLTGLSFHLMERPTVYLVTQAGSGIMVLPQLEKGKLQGMDNTFQSFAYGDDPASWQSIFDRAGKALNIKSGKIGIEPSRLRFLELSFLQNALPQIDFVEASEVFALLRLNKDSEEIRKMKQAADIAQKAMQATLKIIREGMTEKEIANELLVQLLREGSDPEIPFAPVVAMGENSANPHAVPSDRALMPGDLLLVDWGASYKGYFSDITRTFTFGNVDAELVRIGDIVLEANQVARNAGSPGIDAGAIDRAARSVISAAGYGDAFIHRTGHGLGMEAHEAPYIFEENEMILSPGATFTIEPGIYLPGKGGVRIEDDVVMTDEGLVSLTDMPRKVLPIESFLE
jgi:Xaa-Pro dipeptidase